MRRHLLLIAGIFVAMSCGDTSGPRGGRPGEMRVGALTSTSFDIFMTGETNAAGRASVLELK